MKLTWDFPDEVICDTICGSCINWPCAHAAAMVYAEWALNIACGNGSPIEGEVRCQFYKYAGPHEDFYDYIEGKENGTKLS